VPAGCTRLVHADLATAPLEELMADIDCVVHLAFVPGSVPDDDEGHRSVEAAARLLDAAAKEQVSHIVIRSSAVVYGARPDNRVPLTEDTPLRPNNELAYATHMAEVERLVAEWRDAHPSVTATVLRPAVTVGSHDRSWLAEAMRTAAALRPKSEAPAAQFLHREDLAAAVVLAVRDRLDGVFNVAPDGWIDGEEVLALAGVSPRLPLSERAARRLTRAGRRLGITNVPDGLEPYLRHPWVVANDRLRSAGWQPAHTNQQAFVEAHEGSSWTEMSPHKRQNLALGVSGVMLAGAAAGVVAVLRRRR